MASLPFSTTSFTGACDFSTPFIGIGLLSLRAYSSTMSFSLVSMEWERRLYVAMALATVGSFEPFTFLKTATGSSCLVSSFST